METVVAHKGKKGWRCRVRGFEAHSSLTPLGVNAVQIACEIVAYIARRAREFRDAGTQDGAYDVPYTTVHVGVIHGGTALNIVPRDCTFDFEIRHLPFDDPDAFFADVRAFAATFLPAMHAVNPDTWIEFDHLSTLPGIRHARRQRDHVARPRVQRHARRRQGVVRHRSVAVPRRRHPDRHLRPRPHRAGAPAERMGRHRPGREVRGIHAPAGRARRRVKTA